MHKTRKLNSISENIHLKILNYVQIVIKCNNKLKHFYSITRFDNMFLPGF